MRITFRLNDTIQVFRLGKTSNKKIANENDVLVQTYSFSKDQFEHANNPNREKGMLPFYSKDGSVCFDCPFSANQNDKIGLCYTHKSNQFKGFLSMLKSIGREFGSFDSIPELSESIIDDIVAISVNKYVRFGTYGEPSIHPIQLVERVTSVAKNWTGYTHQWFKKPEFAKWFMASVHNTVQEQTARNKFGFRSFIAVKDNANINATKCPASEEMGFKSNCSKCGLCSGVNGKGKKSVVILEH